MFWDTFIELCNQKDVKPNPVARSLGIPSGSVTDWKNGRTPRDTTLKKLADYFGVSVDYLLGKEEKEPPATIGEELEEDVIIFHRDGKTQKRKFTKEQMAMLMAVVDAMPDIPKDDI